MDGIVLFERLHSSGLSAVLCLEECVVTGKLHVGEAYVQFLPLGERDVDQLINIPISRIGSFGVVICPSSDFSDQLLGKQKDQRVTLLEMTLYSPGGSPVFLLFHLGLRAVELRPIIEKLNSMIDERGTFGPWLKEHQDLILPKNCTGSALDRFLGNSESPKSGTNKSGWKSWMKHVVVHGGSKTSRSLSRERLMESDWKPPTLPPVDMDGWPVPNFVSEGLRLILPEADVSLTWRCAFAVNRDGVSYQTLFKNINKRGRSIFLLRDTTGTYFGAYIPFQLERKYHFYGTADVIVFTFRDLDGKCKTKLRRWRGVPTEEGRSVCFSDGKSFCIGGNNQEEAPAIFLDGEMKMGSSTDNNFFSSPQLSSDADFTVADLSIWVLKRCGDDDDDPP